jgi:hypothetical protein
MRRQQQQASNSGHVRIVHLPTRRFQATCITRHTCVSPTSSSPRIGAQRNHHDGDANCDPRGETGHIAGGGSIQVDGNEQKDDER